MSKSIDSTGLTKLITLIKNTFIKTADTGTLDIDTAPTSSSSNLITSGGVYTAVAAKSTVSVSTTGTATDEISYITVDGTEKKIAGGGSSSGPIKSGTGINSAVLNNIEDANTAYGESSHVEGISNVTVSSVISNLSTATDSEIISAWDSLANESRFTLAKGMDAHAEGTNGLALANNSHAEGYVTLASSTCAHSEGRGTRATGSYSHAGGVGAVASGSMSFAHGNNVKATGTSSFAVGVTADDTITSNAGNYAISMGYDTIASGTKSTAIGSGANASASQSIAIGRLSKASGTASLGLGYDVTASGKFSVAIGTGTKAITESQVAIGKYNEEDSNSIFIIGKGTSDSSRSNALTVDSDGNTIVSGKLAVGVAPTANLDVATKQYVDEHKTEKINYTTTVPTSANTDGLKICVLSAEPTTKYDGWLYFITQS